MRRRQFIGLLGGAPVLWARRARAQQSGRVRRVTAVMSQHASDAGAQAEAAALEQGLNELGWTRGRNLELTFVWSGADREAIGAAAKEVVKRECDVIVGRSTPVVEALLRETRSIPIVFVVVVDPVGSGFVDSFAKPGRNVTGFQNYEFSMVGKWLQLLQEMQPGMQWIGYVYNPKTAPLGFVRALEALAPSGSAKLIPLPVSTGADIDSALQQLAHTSIAGVMNVPDISITSNREPLIQAAAKYHLPAIYTLRVFSEDGGLMSYGPVTAKLFYQTASYVDRILKGEKPADLPVQAPTTYELVINLKTAKALGLTVPPTLLARADEVIE